MRKVSLTVSALLFSAAVFANEESIPTQEEVNLDVLTQEMDVQNSNESSGLDARQVTMDDLKEIAMKRVEVKINPVESVNIGLAMNGLFYETYIEKDNGELFSVAQVNEYAGRIKSFYLPDEKTPIDDVLSFVREDYSMIENNEGRIMLGALRMIYNIDTAFPMYVNRFRDSWVLLFDRKENNMFVGFTAKINGQGKILELIYDDAISISEAQMKELESGDSERKQD